MKKKGFAKKESKEQISMFDGSFFGSKKKDKPSLADIVPDKNRANLIPTPKFEEVDVPKTGKEKEELVKKIAANQIILPKEDERLVKAHLVAQTYYKILGRYYNTKFPMNWKERVGKNNAAIGCCSRAFAQASLLKVSIDDYVEAQFWSFDKMFGKEPLWKDLATAGALLRYRKWKQGKMKGVVEEKTINISIIGVYAPRGSMSDVVTKYEEMVLRQMVSQWGSEEKVWQLFGEPGEEEVFMDTFKRTRDVWKQMYLVD